MKKPRCEHCTRVMVEQLDGTCGTCGKKPSDQVIKRKHQPLINIVPGKPKPVDVTALQNRLSRYQNLIIKIAQGRLYGTRSLPAPTSRRLARDLLEEIGVNYEY